MSWLIKDTNKIMKKKTVAFIMAINKQGMEVCISFLLPFLSVYVSVSERLCLVSYPIFVSLYRVQFISYPFFSISVFSSDFFIWVSRNSLVKRFLQRLDLIHLFFFLSFFSFCFGFNGFNTN